MIRIEDYQISKGKKILLIEKEGYENLKCDYTILTSVLKSHLCLLTEKEFDVLPKNLIYQDMKHVSKVAFNLKFREIFRQRLLYLITNSEQFSLITDKDMLTEKQLSYLNEKIGLVKVSDDTRDYLVFGDDGDKIIENISPDIFTKMLKLYYLFCIENKEIRNISENIYLRCVVEGE